MSCDYDVYCPEHDSRHGFSDANHQQLLMHFLIMHRESIAALATLISDCPTGLQLEAGGWGTVRVEWFVKHAGCKLVVRDEYGRIEEGLACRRCGAVGPVQQREHGLFCGSCENEIRTFATSKK